MNRFFNRAVWLVYTIAFFESLVFYAPVASLYRMQYGVTLFQITLTESAFFVVTILLEIPWGFVTARFGYKNTLVAAGFLNLLAAVVFWKADNFGMFLVQRCVLAMAFSGFSGCDIAYLSRLTDPDRQHKTLGKYNAVSFLAGVMIGISFPLIAPFGYRSLALVTLICMGIGFILRLFLPNVESEPQDMLPFSQQWKALWNVLKSNILFLLFVICGAALCEIEHTVSVFFAAPAYQESGIPLNWYGVLNLSLNLAGAIGGILSARLAKRGNGRVVAVCWFLALASSAALSLTRSAGALILLLPLLRFAVQAYLPFEQLLKTQRTGAASRAVVLSAYNMVASVVGIALGPLLGAGTGIDLEYGFFIGFGIMLLAAIAAFSIWRKMRNQLKIDSSELS